MGCVLDLIWALKAESAGEVSQLCEPFFTFPFYTTFPRKHLTTVSSEQPSVRRMPENATEWLHISKTKSLLLLPDRLPSNWLRAVWAVPPGSCGVTFGPPSQYQSGSPGRFDSVLSSNTSYIHTHKHTHTGSGYLHEVSEILSD